MALLADHWRGQLNWSNLLEPLANRLGVHWTWLVDKQHVQQLFVVGLAEMLSTIQYCED